jgi:hypothetical protein
MVALDGNNASMPRVSLRIDPHPEDKQFRIGEGENWYPVDLEFNNGGLHEEIYSNPKDRTPTHGQIV